mmetsp:Transcript_30900/g.43881  ORF Transcript_30900/g.43881 Transcript_30900/m.43881 type:complete len:104 (+) Transcript_30900:84-395(+)
MKKSKTWRLSQISGSQALVQQTFDCKNFDYFRCSFFSRLSWNHFEKQAQSRLIEISMEWSAQDLQFKEWYCKAMNGIILQKKEFSALSRWIVVSFLCLLVIVE